MCHDHDSRPPAPPRRGDVAERGVLTLTAADGTDFSAAYAAPATSAGTGVVLLPDVRGLHPFYVALAEEFARAGLPTVAIDWFGRTAGVAEGGVRGAEFEWRPHVEAATPEGMDADIAAGIAYLRERAGAELPVVTVGFCLGGSLSWRQAGGDLDLAGCVGFYGRPSVVGDAAARAHRPIVMLIAGADQATPVPDSLAAADVLRAKGCQVETHVFDGAPHSFFDRTFADHAQDCDEAWRLMLEFVDRHALSVH